jgi:hypothetical protein
MNARLPRALAALVTAGGCALVVAGGGKAREAPLAALCRVFDAGEGAGLSLVLPLRPTAPERAAADLVRETLAAASGLPATRFPILPAGWLAPAVALRIGGPLPGATEPAPAPPRDNAVGYAVEARGIQLGAERPELLVAAASWFLERETGARWFHPGPWGREVPRRARLSLAAGVHAYRPDFVHRDLGVEPTPAELAWRAANRLEARFEHGHNLTTIFRPEDFRRRPELAPERRGWKHFPAPGEDNWQPDLRHPAAAEHAAAFEGKPTTFPTTQPIIKLNGDHDVFGDGSVIILNMPGHTPGHRSLLVRLKETGNVLLTGDLAPWKGGKCA